MHCAPCIHGNYAPGNYIFNSKAPKVLDVFAGTAAGSPPLSLSQFDRKTSYTSSLVQTLYELAFRLWVDVTFI